MKQALARRYRPRTFQAVVGQDVALRAICNALDTNRLHHAYLFTGTRGVGKTSIARLLAKSLNCEQGISSAPCDKCSACVEINEGRFVDLIEVDAASRTKVEDTRELLDNVQYLPTRGRFKIYLIDEVHMLSNHSFNALLKTLEEPPAHVKFLLATTDPQKLPATILSRCLQFHLWRVPVEQIVSYLAKILQEENIDFEQEALVILARAAEGSLRDALSLLDQSISYSQGRIEAVAVRAMLGLSQKESICALLSAVGQGDAKSVLAQIRVLSNSVSDFFGVLKELLTTLHQIAIAQSAPEAIDESIAERETIIELAAEISSEEIQLYYQIALQGQRDLPYAPSVQMGFEMIMLRMVAFQPVKISRFAGSTAKAQTSVAAATAKPIPTPTPMPGPTPIPSPTPNPKPIIPTPMKDFSNTNVTSKSVEIKETKEVKELQNDNNQQTNKAVDTPNWNAIVSKLNLTGLTKMLAEHCVVANWNDDLVHLILDDGQKSLMNKRYEDRIREALTQHLGRVIGLKITLDQVKNQTPAAHNQRQAEKTYQDAKQMIDVDPTIQKLIQSFDAKIEQVVLKDE